MGSKKLHSIEPQQQTVYILNADLWIHWFDYWTKETWNLHETWKM